MGSGSVSRCFFSCVDVAVLLDPLGYLGVNGLGQELLSSHPQHLTQNIFSSGNWQSPHVDGRTFHGGVLLCPRGQLVKQDTPRVRRLFSIDHPQDLVIPPDGL
jgi:hypothetical protein